MRLSFLSLGLLNLSPVLADPVATGTTINTAPLGSLAAAAIALPVGSVGAQISEMQIELALLDMKIKIATRKSELAKIVNGDSPKSNVTPSMGMSSSGMPGSMIQTGMPLVSSPIQPTSVRPVKPLRTPALEIVQPALPTYEAIDGVDGKMSATLNLASGATQIFKVGDGDANWRVNSISPTKIIVQQGQLLIPLKKENSVQTQTQTQARPMAGAYNLPMPPPLN
jgi:type IV pilus biogenesis protein PilP